MARLVLIQIFLFIAPFALYFFWRFLRREARKGRAAVADGPPYQLLALLGAGFVVMGVAALAMWSAEAPADPSGRYVPAHLEDGELIPGRFVSAEEEAAPSERPRDAPRS